MKITEKELIEHVSSFMKDEGMSDEDVSIALIYATLMIVNWLKLELPIGNKNFPILLRALAVGIELATEREK